MKKVLLGTTALVAASALSVGAANAEMSVNGNAYQSFGFALDSGDQASDPGAYNYQDADIQFRGNATTDSGLDVQVRFDISAEDTGNIASDEMYIQLTDDWGTLNVGSNDSAMDMMVGGAAWATYNGIDSGTWRGYTHAGDSIYTTASFTGDAAGISYFTPTMNGLGIGVSYQGRTGTDANRAANEGGNFHNNLSLGVKYSGDMDGVGLTLAAGVDHSANTTYDNGGAGGDDSRTDFRAHADVSTGGFTLSGSFNQVDYDTSTTAKVDNQTFTLSGVYATGPHSIGLEYGYSEQDTTITTSGDDTEYTGYQIGYLNNLGGGLIWDARIAYFDTDTGTASTSFDVTVFETGIGIYF